MAPDITFHLSDDAFDHFVSLLLQFGIAVQETAHPELGLVCGRPALDCRSGILTHQKRQFRYRRQKVIDRAAFHLPPMPQPGRSIRVFSDGHLSVDIVGHPIDAVEQLSDVLESLFPDPPPQQIPSGTAPPPSHRKV